MPHYENVFIARQDMSSTQVEGLADTYASLLEERGSQIERREHWGLKNLAYRIRKNRKGHYVLLNFEATPDTVNELERQMRLSEDVLRYLTIKLDDAPEGQSAMMASRGRDERGRRSDRDRGDRDRGDRPRREDREEREPQEAQGGGESATVEGGEQ